MMNGCPRWSVLALPLLAALGCSDPVPRPAQGNLTLSLQPPTMGTGTCPVPGRTYVIGNPNGPNSNNAGDRIIDGHGATIKCSVQGNGTFTFSGTIKGTTGTTPSDQVTLTMTNGTINSTTGTVTASVNVTQLAGNFSSPAGGCMVSVVGDNVKPGSLWATVMCPTISDPSAPGKSCSVGPITTFVLENCDGS